MEIEHDFEHYLPAVHPLRRGADLFCEKGKETCVFRTADFVSRFFERAASRILQSIESVSGPLYTLDISAASESLPSHWQKIIDYLYEKKLIAEPRVFFEPPYNDEPKLYIASLKNIPEQKTIIEDHVGHILNAGSAFDFESALTKSLGEFLERYTLLPLPSYPMMNASPAELVKKGKRFLHPREVARFSAEQRLKNPHLYGEDKNAFLWVEGRSLFDNRRILLPAQLVFWHYDPKKNREPHIRESNSNGAAGMITREGAILSGLRELIQRDGFLIFWLNTIPPPRIDPASIDNPEIKRILDSMYRYGFVVEVLDITTEFGLPAFAAVILDGKGDRRRVALGACSEAIPERAIKNSLLEALMIQHTTRRVMAMDPFSLPDTYTPFEDTSIGQFERMKLWTNPRMFSRFRWFVSGKMHPFSDRKIKYEAPHDSKEEFAFLIEKFRSLGQGYEIYYYEAKHPVLAELNYHCVKVVVPALTNLYLDEHLAPLGASRLREVPAKLGYRAMNFPNHLPHPFP